MMQAVRHLVLEYDIGLANLVSWYQENEPQSPWHTLARAAVRRRRSVWQLNEGSERMRGSGHANTTPASALSAAWARLTREEEQHTVGLARSAATDAWLSRVNVSHSDKPSICAKALKRGVAKSACKMFALTS